MSQEGFPGGSDGKESACNVGDLGSAPGLQRSPGEAKGNPVHYSCLDSPMDRGVWWATVHEISKNQARLSDEHYYYKQGTNLPGFKSLSMGIICSYNIISVCSGCARSVRAVSFC